MTDKQFDFIIQLWEELDFWMFSAFYDTHLPRYSNGDIKYIFDDWTKEETSWHIQHLLELKAFLKYHLRNIPNVEPKVYFEVMKERNNFI